MPVNTEHTLYKDHLPEWTKYRDFIAGSKYVKDKGPIYLPRLEGSDNDNSVYEAYKKRTLFYAGAARSTDGLLGSIFRKKPIVSPDTDEVTKNITPDGLNLEEFSKFVTTEVIVTGRMGILVDKNSGDNSEIPKLIPYVTESIINWRMDQTQLTLVVLQEEIEVEGSDKYDTEIRLQFRTLELIDGIYHQSIHVIDKETGSEMMIQEPFAPTRFGKPFTEIPFYPISPVDNSIDIKKSPIADIVEVNLSHYQVSADLSHGLHFTGLPNVVITGTSGLKDTHGNPMVYKIGSPTAWVFPEPEAKAYYLEFKGTGLKSLEVALAQRESLMAVLGARLLTGDSKNVEAFETHQLKRQGEVSILSAISMSVSAQITKALIFRALWAGEDENIRFELNRDYNVSKLTPEEIISLVKTWQVEVISDDDLAFNLKQGEVLSPTTTLEQARSQISSASTQFDSDNITM